MDVNADGGTGGSEPVYLMVGACGAGVAAGDARLSPFAGFPGGTIVTGKDDDVGRTTIAIAAAYGFFDSNGDGAHSVDEDVLLHFGAVPGTAAPGDRALSGPDPFEPLSSGDPRVGRPMLATAVAVGGESYTEHDGTGGYSARDWLYLDLDANGQPSLGDLRIAVPGEPSPQTSSPSSAGNGTSSVSSVQPTGPLGPGGGGQSTSPDSSSDGTRNPTPAPGGLFLALGILLAALVRRRPRPPQPSI